MNTVKGYRICWPIYYTKQTNGHNLYLKKIQKMNGGKFHFRDTKVHKILVNANKRNKIYKIFFVSPLYMSDFVFYIENDKLLTSEEYFFP